MTEHTMKAFDADLQDLQRMVAEMGGLAEKLIADSVDALVKRDVGLAQRVVAADAAIDALQREIEEKAVLTIARRQPMAIDLREIVAALRVSNDLERIGDLAKNIAKRVVALGREHDALAVRRPVRRTVVGGGRVVRRRPQQRGHDHRAGGDDGEEDEPVDRALAANLVGRPASFGSRRDHGNRTTETLNVTSDVRRVSCHERL